MFDKVKVIEEMRGKLKFIKLSLEKKDIIRRCDLLDECVSILNEISSKEIYELKDDVYQLLDSNSAYIRSEAVATLGYPNRLCLPEFRDLAYDIWQNDPDDEVKCAALSAWCGYYRESKDKTVLKKLYNIINDESFSIHIRFHAYSGIFNTVSFRHSAYPTKDINTISSCRSHKEFNSKVILP